MPNSTIRSISGLQTSPNPFSNVPEGALILGDEVYSRAPGVLEPRRGKKYSTPFQADRCFPFPTTSQMFCTLRGAANPLVYNPDTDSVYNLTRSSGLFGLQYPYHTDLRVSLQAAAANGNIYFTTANGIQVAPGITNAQWRTAGLPRPWIYASGFSSGGGLSNVMPNNMRRTYRVTLGFYDELGNFLESAPSEPVNIDNTGGMTVAPGVVIQPPLGCPPGVFWRIYRAPQVPTGTIASDSMYLVVQAAIPSTINPRSNFLDTTNLQAQTIFDQSVDSLLAIPLYTNARDGDGFGLAGANAAPPAAGAIAFFKGRMYYGRPTWPQSLQVQIIGTGTAGGMQQTDAVTIDGLVFSGSNFWAVDSTDPFATNLDKTGRSMSDTINNVFDRNTLFPSGYLRDISQQLRAQYISIGGNDFGRVLIERIFPIPLQDGGQPFTFITTGAGVNFPNGINTSTDNYIPGNIAWSKPNLPESVPRINQAVIGDSRSAILAFSVHRDIMLIWKEDGVWIARDDGGPQPTFSQLDTSVNLIAPATLGVVDNASYAFTDRGLLQVTEQGTIPVGEPIRTDLTKLLNLSQNALAQAFAIAYDSERLYILALPASSSELTSSIQYVLRVPDAGFPPQLPRLTRFLHQGTSHGMLLPRTNAINSNRLAFVYSIQAGSLGFNLLNQPLSGAYVERKGGVVSMDYVDFTGSIANPATTTSNTLTFPQDVHLEMFPGDVLIYNPGGIGTKIYTMRILSVNKAVVTLDNSYPFTVGGTFNYFRGIQAHWRHTAITLGEPTAEKQWRYGQVYFDYFDGDWLSYLMDSEKAPLQPLSISPADPLVSNLGGTAYTSTGLPGQGQLPGPNSPPSAIGNVQWLRNCRDVILRVDPGQAEARGGRLGAEFIFAQALASFRLTAFSASAHEWKEASTR